MLQGCYVGRGVDTGLFLIVHLSAHDGGGTPPTPLACDRKSGDEGAHKKLNASECDDGHVSEILCGQKGRRKR
jgi:hypothetical protein